MKNNGHNEGFREKINGRQSLTHSTTMQFTEAKTAWKRNGMAVRLRMTIQRLII